MYLDCVEEARKIIAWLRDSEQPGRAEVYVAGHLERFRRNGIEAGRSEIIAEIQAVCDQPRAD